MAYEYSGQGGRLDFPNPFYAENWFLAGASVISLGGAFLLLFQSRDALSSGHGLVSWLPLILGVALLLLGLRFGQRMMTQLRFFFGRSEPVGLAKELTQDQAGQSEQSGYLKRILRQNALEFAEPSGPLNGLLYAWIRDLIFSPAVVQNTAQRQFQTAIAIVVTLVSFLVAWAGLSDTHAAEWMGLFYFLFSVFLLLRPLDQTSSARVGMGLFVVLILVAVFAPVVLPRFTGGLPDISWLSLGWQTLFLLLASLLAVGMYFLALIRQMNQPPHTNMACETTALSMNCHPKQLLDELDRNLQEGWTDRIPNRRYARTLPEIADSKGPFSAELVEETQPLPSERERISPLAATSLPRFRWIAMLDLLGVVMVLVGVAWTVLFGLRFDPASIDLHLFATLTFGIAMLTLSSYCLRVGHALWARIDFASTLVWVEMEGNYQSAQVDLGNNLTSQMRTSRQVINIETMTLRVWAAEIDSVIFGKRGARSIIALRGLPDYARNVVQHLTTFAQDQSVIVAPTSAADLQKGKLLGAMNQMAGQPAASIQPLLQATATASGGEAAPPATHCTQCGKPLQPGQRFCGNCGAPVAAAVV